MTASLAKPVRESVARIRAQINTLPLVDRLQLHLSTEPASPCDLARLCGVPKKRIYAPLHVLACRGLAISTPVQGGRGLTLWSLTQADERPLTTPEGTPDERLLACLTGEFRSAFELSIRAGVDRNCAKARLDALVDRGIAAARTTKGAGRPRHCYALTAAAKALPALPSLTKRAPLPLPEPPPPPKPTPAATLLAAPLLTTHTLDPASAPTPTAARARREAAKYAITAHHGGADWTIHPIPGQGTTCAILESRDARDWRLASSEIAATRLARLAAARALPPRFDGIPPTYAEPTP